MWDLKNYHLYNPYAAWHDRYDVDVAPGQLQSYLNPILDFPFYFAVRLFNDRPRLIAFLMGVPQGVNLWAVVLLTWHVLRSFGTMPASLRLGLTLVALLIGATGAGSLPLIGSTTGDIPVAAPILLGLFALVRSVDAVSPARPLAGRGLWIAGGLTGLAVGAKLPMAVYGVGLLAATVVALPRGVRLGGTARVAAGALGGALMTGGYHHLRMALLFGNPLFPLMNALFHSPYWEDQSIRDTRFLPRSALEALIYPFEWAVATGPSGIVSELGFRDIRAAMVLTLAAILAATWVLGRLLGTRSAPVEPGIRALVTFVAVSYGLWLDGFSIYRYLIPLEILSGTLIVIGLVGLVRQRALPALSIAATTACLVTTAPLDWGHTPFRDHYVEVSAPPLPHDALVLIVGTDPVSYLLPFMDPGAVWISLQNNFLRADENGLLVRRERDLVANHQGPLMVLDAGVTPASLAATLSAFGLTTDLGTCVDLSSNLGAETHRLCEARHIEG